MAIDLRNYEPALRAGSDLTTTGTLTVGAFSVTGTTTLTGVVTATAGVTTPVNYTALSATGNTSGGVSTPALTMGTSGIGIYYGDGAPTISATKGSLYLNFTGSSSSTRLYVNNGTTTWVAVTTAS